MNRIDFASSTPAALGISQVTLPPGFMTLFHAIEALRTLDKTIIVQFVAAGAGTGTTTVAAGFARAAAACYGVPVCVLDAAPAPGWRPGQGPALLAPPCLDEGSGVEPASLLDFEPTHVPNVSRARLIGKNGLRQPLEAILIQRLFERLRSTYGAVIIDCPPLAACPEAGALARFCDGTVLVAAAGVSAPRELAAARAEIVRLGGQVIGAVFNRERSYLPRWLGRWF